MKTPTRATLPRSRRLATIALAILACGALARDADAEVRRIEVLSCEPFADGQSFGEVGDYQLLKGKLHYAVDPTNPANARIVDLEYAPRDENGMVVFVGDFELLKPVDFALGNRRLYYDVANRGNKVILGNHNAAWGNDPGAGNGFLMRLGYSILWTGWNWDVLDAPGLIQLELPVATIDGKPIRQQIAAEMVLTFDRRPARSQTLCWGNARCYPAIDTSDDSPAVLTVRDSPRGEREVISREEWHFGRLVRGELEPSATWVTIDDGFQLGKIYELVYEVQDPPVVGLGLASVRDAISFFHFEAADRDGTTNPLAIRWGDDEPVSGVEKAYIYGTSQSGRFITHLLWQGFHVDEQERMVIEGARIHVAGGGKGGFNHRFAQTSQHPSHLEGNYMPADHPPFNYLPADHPGSGGPNDVLAVAKQLGKIPRILIDNNELEYWTRSASLVHTTTDGARDVPFHESVRYYAVNGAPHGGSGSRDPGVHEHELNTIEVSPFLRAMVVQLDRWVSEDEAPPASRYPRLERGELLSAAEHAKRFPKIPGLRHPGVNLQPPRVDYGPRFWTEGIIDVVPPRMGESYVTLVPAFDGDGNSIGGVRLPEVAVPLGTYQGWNPRRAEFGAPGFLGRFVGSFWAFAATADSRDESGDPRASIAERYVDQESYVGRVEEVCGELVDEGFLLPEDADAFVQRASELAWPPQGIPRPPFWRYRAR